MRKSAEQVFVDYLQKNKLMMTPQRRIITDIFLETEGHFSAEDLSERVRAVMPELGQATVYRTLKLLVESGLAETINPGDGALLYEHSYAHAHHDHLICMGCGRKVEILDEAIEARQEALAAEHGFKLTSHRVYLYGLCSECRNKEDKKEDKKD